MDNKYSAYKDSYSDKGTILVGKDDESNPINKDELNELLTCCEKVSKEFIEIGDAGEHASYPRELFSPRWSEGLPLRQRWELRVVRGAAA